MTLFNCLPCACLNVEIRPTMLNQPTHGCSTIHGLINSAHTGIEAAAEMALQMGSTSPGLLLLHYGLIITPVMRHLCINTYCVILSWEIACNGQ